MGSRAERKERRKKKIQAYKEQIAEAFASKVVEIAERHIEDDTEFQSSEAYEVNMAQCNKVMMLVKACPQEKMLIVEANNQFVEEADKKAGQEEQVM